MANVKTNEPDGTAQEVRITHVFDAGRERVFRAWTDPAQLEKWYAPHGCTIIFKTLDVRKGGSFHSCLWNPQYGNCWCKGTYLDVQAPEKLVYTMEVTDEQGRDVNPADAGMDPDWPAVTTVTVTFHETNGKTEVHLYQTVPETLAKKTGAHPGWIKMLERLGESFTASIM